MIPIWAYIAVPALIAALAFALGQSVPGLGVPFAAAASIAWTAWSAHRQRLAKRG